jgi:hypothetical protein
MLALSLQDVPSDSPPRGDCPPPSRAPGPLAPTDGSHLPIPTDPPRLHTRPSAPIGGGSRSPRRSRSSARAPNPGPPGGHLEDLARGVPDMPAVRQAARFARLQSPDTRLDTVSADQFLLRTPGSGWPGDGHGGLSTVRTSQFKGDRPADEYGPGPDSDGQAADTSSAQRPTMRLATRPWPPTRPARPGPDRTETAMRMVAFGQPNRYQHREPSVVTTCTRARCRNVRKLGPRPMSTRSCPASNWTPRSDSLPEHRLPGHIRRTPSPPPGTPWRTRSDADRERTNGTEGTRTPSIATITKTARRDTPSPLRWGRRLRLGKLSRDPPCPFLPPGFRGSLGLGLSRDGRRETVGGRDGCAWALDRALMGASVVCGAGCRRPGRAGCMTMGAVEVRWGTVCSATGPAPAGTRAPMASGWAGAGGACGPSGSAARAGPGSGSAASWW